MFASHTLESVTYWLLLETLSVTCRLLRPLTAAMHWILGRSGSLAIKLQTLFTAIISLLGTSLSMLLACSAHPRLLTSLWEQLAHWWSGHLYWSFWWSGHRYWSFWWSVHLCWSLFTWIKSSLKLKMHIKCAAHSGERRNVWRNFKAFKVCLYFRKKSWYVFYLQHGTILTCIDYLLLIS